MPELLVLPQLHCHCALLPLALDLWWVLAPPFLALLLDCMCMPLACIFPTNTHVRTRAYSVVRRFALHRASPCLTDALQALQSAANGRLETSLALCEQFLEQLGQEGQQATGAEALWGAEGEPSSCEVGLVHKQRMECMQQLAHWADVQEQVGPGIIYIIIRRC